MSLYLQYPWHNIQIFPEGKIFCTQRPPFFPSLSLSLSCGLQGSIQLTLPTGSDLWTPHYAAVPRPTLANLGGETHGSYMECWGCTQSTEGCPGLPPMEPDTIPMNQSR